MSDMVNLVRVLTAATGNSSPITLGAAYSQLFMTPAEAGAVDGRTYTWLIVDGNNWELVKGAYTAAGTQMARTTVLASRISGTLGTTKLTLSGTAQVRLVQAAEDMGALRGTRTVTGASDPIVHNDLGRAIVYNRATAVAASLAQAGASSQFLDGWSVYVKNIGAGSTTITPATSTINGAATLVLAQNMGAFIWSDGTNYHAVLMPVTAPLLATNNLSDLASAQAARGNLGIMSPPQGRLTLESGAPISTSAQNGKTTIHLTPYCGNQLPVWDGIKWTMRTFTELSVATNDTAKNPAAIGASKVNDWFYWDDGGTLRLSHGPDWTSDTARSAGTALVTVDGVLMNAVAITNGPAIQRGVYVGTTRSNASSSLDFSRGGSASGGVAALLNVWNMYNRVNVAATVTDSGTGYTSNTPSRQARASSGNQVNAVIGVAEESFSVNYTGRGTTAASTGSVAGLGIGIDTASTLTVSYPVMTVTAVAMNSGMSPSYNGTFGLGYHFVAAMEFTDGTNCTFNTASNNALSLMTRM